MPDNKFWQHPVFEVGDMEKLIEPIIVKARLYSVSWKLHTTKRTKANLWSWFHDFCINNLLFARDTKFPFSSFVGSVFQRATSNNYDMIPFGVWNAD